MSKNIDRFTIWKIEKKELTLEKVLELLNKNYNQKIKYLDGYEIEENDKTLNNKWINPDGSNKLKIKNHKKNYDGNNNDLENIKYIYAKGLFETNLSEERAIVNGKVLPRESRVFNHSCEACFFEIKEAIYVVLKVNSTDESKVRNKLMKYRNDSNEKDIWGKVKYNKVDNYEIDSKFFYWLLYKKDKVEEIEFETEKIRVLDISQVLQEDKYELYTTHSMGEDILGSTSALSAFGESQKINKTGVIFVNQDVQIAGLLDINSVFFIDNDKSKIEINENEFVDFAIYIYTYLIPQLFKAWDEEKESSKWDDKLLKSLTKKWAINAILNLSKINDISLDEIDEAMNLDEE